jgi:hypothetical protein
MCRVLTAVSSASIIRAMVDAVRISETSIYFNETTRRYVTEGRHLKPTLTSRLLVFIFH